MRGMGRLRCADWNMARAPDEDQAEAFNPMAMLGSMSSLLAMFTGVVLPATQVARATKRVQETYVKDQEVETGG